MGENWQRIRRLIGRIECPHRPAQWGNSSVFAVSVFSSFFFAVLCSAVVYHVSLPPAGDDRIATSSALPMRFHGHAVAAHTHSQYREMGKWVWHNQMGNLQRRFAVALCTRTTCVKCYSFTRFAGLLWPRHAELWNVCVAFLAAKKLVFPSLFSFSLWISFFLFLFFRCSVFSLRSFSVENYLCRLRVCTMHRNESPSPPVPISLSLAHSWHEILSKIYSTSLSRPP